MSKRSLFALIVVSLAAALAACSGGGGGAAPSSTVALTVTEKVSVVEPKISGALASSVKPLLMAASVPADSDYAKDVTNVYVEERSVEGFKTINEILCMVSQTKYETMLNAGAYIALVDSNKCSSEKSKASSAGQESQDQSSGSDAPRYMKWVVNVTRADNNSPEYLNAWIHEPARENGGDPDKIIYAKMEITEGKSDTNPIGIFVVNFRAVAEADPNTVLFKGYLRAEKDASTGKVLLKFASDDISWGSSQQATLDKGAGKGKVHSQSTNPDYSYDSTMDIAYNTDYFHRMEVGGTDVCLDRNNFKHSAWSYGLYNNTDGARINRDSGFSINTSSDGKGAYGWVGYWGVWLDSSAGALTNGQKVYNIDYRTKTSTAYDVFVAGGKLKKHTKKNLTLGEIKGVPMDYWEWNSQANSGTQFRVLWDGTNFNKIAQMPSNCSSNCSWQNIVTSPTPTINFSQVQWSELNFWSQSLGGQVRVPLSGCSWLDPDGSGSQPGFTMCNAPSNTTTVVFFKEDVVYPTDTVPGSLACYDNNCLKAGASGIVSNDSTYQTWDPLTGKNTAYNYTFNSTTMLLNDTTSGYSVVSNPTDTMNQWGYNSGALFDPSILGQKNPDTGKPYLQCDWMNATGGYDTCGWKAWSELPVFYTWETGNNNWNQFTGLKDSAGAFKKFLPPLQVKYVNAAGATYMLDYSGFGQLQGIPGICVNMDTGDVADCSTGGKDNKIRWVPEFTIMADSMVVDDANVTYLVKPLEMEQRMVKADPANCTALTAGSFTLPTIADWVDPAIGTEPAVTDPPAIIGGVVQ